MPFPPLGEMLTETPLYTPFPLEDGDKAEMVGLRGGNFQIDCFCLRCEKEAVHKTKRTVGGGAGLPGPPTDWMFKDGFIFAELFCARCDHPIVAAFSIHERKLTKWGQLPSVSDLSGADLRVFRKVLSEDDYAELNRAIGLMSHGVGIGAFVYLRRIFERLVSRYATAARKAGTLGEDFDTLRMREKVSALKDLLPNAVYEYRDAYSILSLGIHELSERECKAAYPIIYAAVRLMLEEEAHKRDREKAEADLKKQFEAIKSGLNKTARSGQADKA